MKAFRLLMWPAGEHLLYGFVWCIQVLELFRMLIFQAGSLSTLLNDSRNSSNNLTLEVFRIGKFSYFAFSLLSSHRFVSSYMTKGYIGYNQPISPFVMSFVMQKLSAYVHHSPTLTDFTYRHWIFHLLNKPSHCPHGCEYPCIVL
jgi:hypothetical protein